MKKIKVAIALSKHITLLSLHVYALTHAVKNGNTQAVAQLLKSPAIARFSPLHQATVLGAALHHLVNNEEKDHAITILVDDDQQLGFSGISTQCWREAIDSNFVTGITKSPPFGFFA